MYGQHDCLNLFKIKSKTFYYNTLTIVYSFSDDNSSIQSSPWQRDHTWKQTCPSRNISTAMNLYFWKPKKKRCYEKSKIRRKPYAISNEIKNNTNCHESKKKHPKQSLMAIIQILIEKR